MEETIAITGATGFVGSELLNNLRNKHKLIALTRSSSPSKTHSQVEWRSCDFFSVDSLAEALTGVTTAIYLIHSMMPTARLDQSSFEDTDLWLADSFARAAAIAGVKRIIYLGGLVPEGAQLSAHLRSRKEVEDALGSRGVPVVTLRAGLILGARGSSFQILYLLVRRLPWMLCPRWAWTRMQPVSLTDVIRLIDFCVSSPDIPSGAYDIGGPDVVTYRDLMLECARIQGLRRRFLHAPFFTPGLSTLWVCLVTGASRRLVAPLVRSMSHSMVVTHIALLERFGQRLESAHQALSSCISTAAPQLRAETRKRRRDRGSERDVRSIQRIKVPESWTAQTLAQEYFRWVGQKMRPLIRVKRDQDGIWHFGCWLVGNQALLKLRPRANPISENPELQCFDIIGGILLKAPAVANTEGGTFEFRVSRSPVYALVGLHGFRPKLPWGIYKVTQAVAHQFIMFLFASWLSKQRGLPC